MRTRTAGRSLVVAIIAFYCRLAGSLAPIAVSARCSTTGHRAPSVRMEEHEGKRVHAARWQQYAAGGFTPPAPLGRARDDPPPDAQGMLPPALRAWVERSFAQCTEDDEHSIVEREFLQRVAQGGLDQVDWDAEPLIDMTAASSSGSEAPWRQPAPAAVVVATPADDGAAWQAEAAGAAEQEADTYADETLAARLQPRMSHKEQMARLAEAAHAAEVEALATRVTPRSVYAQQRELQAEVARAPPRLQPRRRAESQARPREQIEWVGEPRSRRAEVAPQAEVAQAVQAVQPFPGSALDREWNGGGDRSDPGQQPRRSHREQMALLAQTAHAAEARALAARRLEFDGASAVAVARQEVGVARQEVGRARGVEQASSLRAREIEVRQAAAVVRQAGQAARAAGADRRSPSPPGGLRAAPAPTSVSATGHSIRIRDRREMKP